LLYD
jgi:hypothetical protein